MEENDERPVAGQAVSHTAVDWLGVEAGGGDEGPKRSEEVRTLLMPLVFLAAGIAALVKGWLVAGIVLLVLGVSLYLKLPAFVCITTFHVSLSESPS